MLFLVLPALNAAVADDASALSGTWNVTSVETTESSCTTSAGDTGKTTSYIWIVSTTATGAVTVSVQGETSFPRLTGSAFNGKVNLEGDSEFKATKVGSGVGYVASSSWFSLTVTEGQLTGTRRLLSYRSMKLANGSEGITPCFSDYKVLAKR